MQNCFVLGAEIDKIFCVAINKNFIKIFIIFGKNGCLIGKEVLVLRNTIVLNIINSLWLLWSFYEWELCANSLKICAGNLRRNIFNHSVKLFLFDLSGLICHG